MIGGIEANRKKCGDASVPFAETIFIFNAMNKTETLQAAEVMRRAAEGEMVELTRRDYLQWRIEPGHPGFNWVAFDYRILDFPPPPQGQKWHNPANLNATQVGVHEGWRLLLDGELNGCERTDVQSNFGHADAWCSLGTHFYPCVNMTVTMRTRTPFEVHNVVLGEHCYICTRCNLAAGDGDGFVGQFCTGVKSPLPEVKADPFEEAWPEIERGEREFMLSFKGTVICTDNRISKARARISWQAFKEQYKIKD